MAKSKIPYILIPLVTTFALQGALAANITSTASPAVANYARPISFEPNRGQTDNEVDFLAHGTGYSLFLSHGKAVMVLKQSAIVRIKPVGANNSPPPAALDEQSSKSNYFIGNVPERWHTRIPNYAKVRYRNVYPGVDMIYYGNQRQLEYDFVVSPGADPGSITLEFQGISKAELDREGAVVMHTTAGDLRWHKPIAYQEVDGSRKLVACAYTRRGGQRLGFKLHAYDRAKPLIIDPVLDYSTYLGGSGIDAGYGIAVDARGNAYVTGETASTDFPIKNAFQQTLKNEVSTVFVTKLNLDGDSLVYSTYLGGSNFERGNGIAVDAHGNAYVTGVTTSDDFPTKNAFQPKPRNDVVVPSISAFATKLDVDGDALVYSTYLSGSDYDVANGIAADAHGNAYVTGETDSTDFPTKNAFQPMLAGTSGNAFVTKVNTSGSLVYSTYLGGSGLGDGGLGIAVDARCHAYVTGFTNSTDFPTKNAFQPLPGGPSTTNAFVTKIDADGDKLVYSTYLGGSGFSTTGNLGNGIAVDSHDHAYVTGLTTSTDFPTKNALQATLKGGTDAFVTKFDADGKALVYSTYLGGSGIDAGYGIAADAHGNAYVTGETDSTDFPTKNAFQKELRAPDMAFVAKIGPTGCTVVYSTYLGGSAFDAGNGIAVNAAGDAYVTGYTESFDFPTKNAFQPMLGGPNAVNAFVTKFSTPRR